MGLKMDQQEMVINLFNNHRSPDQIARLLGLKKKFVFECLKEYVENNPNRFKRLQAEKAINEYIKVAEDLTAYNGMVESTHAD